MIKATKKLLSTVKDQSSFDRLRPFLYCLRLANYTSTQYVTSRVIRNLSKTGQLFMDGRNSFDTVHSLIGIGSGVHFVKLKSCYALLVNTTAEKTDERNKMELFCFLWDRDKMLKEIVDELPMYKDYTRIEFTGSKNNRMGSLNPKFGELEQFVRDEDYDIVDSAFKSMLEGPDSYEERNKAFKETILLYGAPGTGKSTLIRHFAAKYKLDLIVADPSAITSGPFLNARSRDQLPVIILMEDIDSAKFLCKEQTETLIDSTVDYGTFINWLDGLQPLDNVIIFLTTNYIDKIIPSVIRGGRVNRKLEMKPLMIKEINDFLDPKWHKVSSTYKDGDITVAMIPDLRVASNEEEFHHLVKILA